MSDRVEGANSTPQKTKPASSDPRSGVELLMPLITVLARRIASEYGSDRSGHTDLSRWPWQLGLMLGAMFVYFLLRS